MEVTKVRAQTLSGKNDETIKNAIMTAAIRKGITTEQFVLQAAAAAGHKPKKARRIVQRFLQGHGTPDCARQHLLAVMNQSHQQ